MINKLLQAYISGLRNIFKLKWRMSKSDFCRFMVVHFFVCLLLIVCFFLSTDLGANFSKVVGDYYFYKDFFQSFRTSLLFIFVLIPYLAMVHRFQDIGKSGFNVLFYMLEGMVGSILCLICVYFCKEVILPEDSLYDYESWEKVQNMMDFHSLCVLVPGWMLFFVVSLFLMHRWFLVDGDRTDNKFGKVLGNEQNKVNQLFLILTLLLITFVWFLLCFVFFEWATNEYFHGTLA